MKKKELKYFKTIRDYFEIFCRIKKEQATILSRIIRFV